MGLSKGEGHEVWHLHASHRDLHPSGGYCATKAKDSKLLESVAEVRVKQVLQTRQFWLKLKDGKGCWATCTQIKMDVCVWRGKHVALILHWRVDTRVTRRNHADGGHCLRCIAVAMHCDFFYDGMLILSSNGVFKSQYLFPRISFLYSLPTSLAEPTRFAPH